MKENDILNLIANKEIEPENIAERVMEKPNLLPELMSGVSSRNARIRFGSAKILRMISKKNPETLYSSWDFFVELLDVKNNILKWIAMDIIAYMTAVDSQNKFNGVFRKFYNKLYEGSLITAGHVIDNSGKIALAKPMFKDEITKELLKVEHIPLPTEECRNIIIGKTIAAFQVYYDEVQDKQQVISFVEGQLSNSRNATRTKARYFLKKLDKRLKGISAENEGL